MSVANFPLDIEQGASFDNTLQWLGGGKFIAPIEDIVVGYPTIITVTAHMLNAVSPTPVIISGVDGCEDLNSVDTGIGMATRVDDDTFSMPVSTVADLWVPGTGEITYFMPSNITGWGGECNIRKNWHSTTILHQISTELGTMTLDGTDGSIRLQIDQVDTAAFTFWGGVYDIDLWPGGGARPTAPGNTIIRVFRGPVSLYRDT